MKISMVVSVFNEEEVLEQFWQALARVLRGCGFDSEVIFVNDGSTDGSAAILRRLARDDERIRVVNFSRNFGHEAAMTAGIDHAAGEAVICLDADLQHPPELIPQMVERFGQGFEIVTMVRSDTDGARFLHRTKSRLFYLVLNLISSETFAVNASDFFLISGRVRRILLAEFRERTRFLRGLIQTIGFSRTSIWFAAPRRAGGETKYSLLRLLTFSLSAMATFSRLPLRAGLLVGSLFGCFSLLVGVYSILMKILGYVIPGYTTIVVLLSFLFAIQFLVLGVIGEYIGFLFDEIKRRPIYIVESMIEPGEGAPLQGQRTIGQEHNG